MPDSVTTAGRVAEYVSPYGKAPGLLARLAYWSRQFRTNRALPWFGTGFIADLEFVMKLLNLREYAEWLKLHGPAEQQQFADDILRDQETLEAVGDALRHAGLQNYDEVAAVELLDRERRRNNSEEIDAIRAVLVENGALEESDHDTPLADLLRALLS